jgi:hypothetical protein
VSRIVGDRSGNGAQPWPLRPCVDSAADRSPATLEAARAGDGDEVDVAPVRGYQRRDGGVVERSARSARSDPEITSMV